MEGVVYFIGPESKATISRWETGESAMSRLAVARMQELDDA